MLQTHDCKGQSIFTIATIDVNIRRSDKVNLGSVKNRPLMNPSGNANGSCFIVNTMTDPRSVLSAADYAVVGATLLASGGIGVFFAYRGRRGASDDYLLGGRNMGIMPVVLSLAATAQTAVGTLGFPGEVYLYGAQLFLYPLGYAVALVMCTFVHTPVYFGLKITSAYEYLEMRFGKITRSVISGLFIIQMVLFMSVGLYSPSIALSAVTGLSHVVSILAVGSVCAFYCTFGGMKAVLWTDVLQATLMFSALSTVAVKGTVDIGGTSEVVRIAEEGGRLQFFDTSLDPTLRFTVWSALIGGFIYGLTTTGANQTQVQRLLTLSTLKRSQLALLISIPANLVMYYTLYTCGLVIYANFAGCDPLLRTESSGIRSADQLVPYFAMRSLGAYPGAAGFCVSGIFCAALSSISSAVNSLAAVTHQDCVTPMCNATAGVATSKALALFYSLLCIGMTYLVGNIKAIIPAAFVVFTAIGGPTFSLITLGMTTATTNQKGALVGLVAGIALNAWIGAGSLLANAPQHPLLQSIDMCPALNTSFLDLNGTFMKGEAISVFEKFQSSTSAFYLNITTDISAVATTETVTVLEDDVFFLFRLSFLLHPVPGTLVTLLLGYLVSFVTGGSKDVDERLVCPFLRKYLGARVVEKGELKLTTEESHQLEIGNGTATRSRDKSDVLEESKL
ncbi:hypothetical protein JTE90_012830 [Oedothorax gibbosus]|uniref:Sodium-coupled monocarboxylate transporter 1 n=1 Tax=Oedothorax gibbosus TaxID=931172 RepID=A0AAV6VYS1_9ARAC|nr:hypothetical protein JTE90_012830 [Oedothorax gibbosus]